MIPRLTSLLYGALILLFLLMEVMSDDYLRLVTACIIVSAIIMTFIKARFVAQLIATLFISSGVALLIYHKAGLVDFLRSFGDMLFVVAFFTVLPVVSLPVRVCHYDETIMAFIRDKARSLKSEYLSILAISYFYGIFLNLAAVPMSYHSLQPIMRIDNVPNKERFLYFSMSQGFTTPLIWTPFSGMLGTIIIAFGISWVSLLPLLLILSGTVLLLSFLVHWQILRRHERPPSPPEDAAVSAPYAWQLFELFAVVLVLLGTVIILEGLLSLGLIISIVLIAFPFSYGWCLVKRRVSELNNQVGDYLAGQLPRMHALFMVFLCAGFLVGAMQKTGMTHVISEVSLILLHGLDARIIYAGLPLIVIAFSFLGLHPIVLLVLLTGSIDLTNVGLDPVLLALSYLCGAVSTFLISPFSGTIGILKSFTDRSITDVILTNVPTVLIIYLVFMVAIQWQFVNTGVV